ncbi:thioesterase [Streptomyces mashuensis]|uniref:Thioesterase n=1 Tax=Streptomyces mashuensis TaxID=33904 RepID=A0A919EDX4_9ACTN|nr:thioesterase domain-containing protein [Streptomyces mashuensis]GHF52713.1 thioesterase [Streptomyces mashuensis]
MTEETALADIALIRVVQPATPSSFRLVCFPDSDNSTAYYLALAELLLPTVELLVVQYPEAGEPHVHGPPDDDPHRAETAAAALADSVLRSLAGWTGHRLALFGHGSGAHLAQRVAERLERDTAAGPVTLFVSGSNAPHARVPLGPPALGCRVVALAGDHDPRTTPAGVRGWRRCTSGRFDLEVLPGAREFLDTHRREVVNIVHDQLMSLSTDPSEHAGDLRKVTTLPEDHGKGAHQ